MICKSKATKYSKDLHDANQRAYNQKIQDRKNRQKVMIETQEAEKRSKKALSLSAGSMSLENTELMISPKVNAPMNEQQMLIKQKSIIITSPKLAQTS